MSPTGSILYVSPETGAGPAGGRELLSRLIRTCLSDLGGDAFHAMALEPGPSSLAARTAGALSGYVDGVGRHTIGSLLDRVARDRIDTVVLDGSNLGALARALKRARPAVRIVVFFHNVEARFFWGALRKRLSAKAAAVLLANFIAERMAVRYADIRITLSERDSGLLRRLYGRGATHVSPIAVADRAGTRSGEPATREGYLLFVGGAFYANREGISWYARHVAPRIALRTVVVGYGMEDMRAELEASGRIEVVGAVDSLAPWYRGALAAVAPIFDGSGMKTKVAEALMFGTRIIGTPEAFSGYDDVARQAGRLCRTAEEFVAAVTAEGDAPAPSFDPNLRRLFERHYSPEAFRRRLAEILGMSTPAEQRLSA